ncbi:MAG: hypothetical protein AMJ88_17720 [Anaerolineae bacterium SM23_ 63]|nr:MAG: hypothetical protein AMJ88_17720 [Anaerolineae bacterium SM23_ 63]
MALGVSLAVVIVALVPYLLADRLAHPGIFSGFLINPIDGFSYLAKMRQGVEGSWSFHLPYSSEPGPGAFIFTFYLFLGNVARWLNIPLLSVYYVARFVAGFAMFSLGYFFYDQVFEEKYLKWIATLLTMVGSGLGWLAVPFGIQASDLSIPESIPFLTAYSNAHFPLAAAVMLGAALSVFKKGRTKLRVVAALSCGILLGIVLPFSMVSLTVSLGVWLIWEGFHGGWNGLTAFIRKQRTHLIPYLALIIGALPWLVYDLWIARFHPSFSVWNAQNITPSPPFVDYVIGYGLILVLAILGLVRIGSRGQSRDRLFISWVLSNIILLYMPFNFQRRLTLGLFFPLAGLAALGLERIVGERAKIRTTLIFLLILSVPSNLLVIGAGISGVKRQDPSLIHLQGELEGYAWIDENTPPGSLILASPEVGNRLPAYADVRVLYGHPFETPYADTQRSLVESLYAWQGSTEEANHLIDQLDLDYVFFGERERKLGQPEWIEQLSLVFDSQGVEIYEVTSP